MATKREMLETIETLKQQLGTAYTELYIMRQRVEKERERAADLREQLRTAEAVLKEELECTDCTDCTELPESSPN